VARAAVEDLDRLIDVLSLPRTTRERVRSSLTPPARFPLIGTELTGEWSDFRFVLGPWRWMLIVYVVLDEGNRVVVVTIQDARSARAATASG